MRNLRRLLAAGVLGGGNPVQRLTSLFGRSSIVEIWPLNETSGSVAYGAVNGYNGVYTGVDLANAASRVPGQMCPYFDGVNDVVALSSVGLLAALNTAEGSAGILARVYDASVWTDGVARRLLNIRASGTNYISLQRIVTNDFINITRVGSGTNTNISKDMTAYLDWFCMCKTWTMDGDAIGGYVNGASMGAPLSGNGVFVGSPTVAVGSTIETPSSVWYGYLSYAYLLNRAATAAEIASANRILGGA
jgi:hypothetical protein